MVNKLINDTDFISVIDKVHDVIEIWDDNYTLVYVNSAVYKSLGKRPSELIGKTLQEIQSDSSYWTPSMLKYIYKYKKKVVQTQKTILGSRYRCIGTPIINTSGLLTNIVITSRRIDDDLFKIVDPVLTNDEFLLDNNSSCSIIYKSEIMHETLSIAKKIYERHTELSDFLVLLGVNPDIAVQDACKIEHDISDETFQAIKLHVQRHRRK